jgi:trehalose 6-phosphate phosphatase
MTKRARSQPGSTTPPAQPLDAVLFDMDGVVTDTAEAHAAAWKQLFDEYLKARAERSGEVFHAFDPDHDYRQHVDGKPRYDGVSSFLGSRGIELPYGITDDAPDAETVCGLGNRKNRHFRAWLEHNRVRTYPGTRRLIADLRDRGIRTAVFSASRNAEAVLRNAGVSDLFDARVDGRDIAALGLPGKPDPAMLREAATRLGASPRRTAVLEDAIAGVEAGARGGFGLVIGIDRGTYGDDLKQAGAHLVVRDAAELRLDETPALIVKTLANLPAVWDREERIRHHLSTRTPAVFLDYDGTLTPIVTDHAKAFLSDDMRAAVKQLAERCTVAIVSGRDLQRLQELVGIGSVFYAGSHGFEIAGPEGWSKRLEKGVEFLPDLDEAETTLRDRLSDIEGHSVERKRFSIAVHFRQVADADLPRLQAVVDEVLSNHRGFHKGYGKKVFEIQPDIDWNKGHAVLWLLEQLELDRSGIVPIYVGDDITDEYAFRALAGHGLSIVVRDRDARPTAADHALAGTDDVKRFLEFLTSVTSE